MYERAQRRTRGSYWCTKYQTKIINLRKGKVNLKYKVISYNFRKTKDYKVHSKQSIFLKIILLTQLEEIHLNKTISSRHTNKSNQLPSANIPQKFYKLYKIKIIIHLSLKFSIIRNIKQNNLKNSKISKLKQ